MTGLKEIDGKWYQLCKVVMLSTKEKERTSISQKVLTNEGCKIGTLEYHKDLSKISLNNEYWKSMNLYITSDEEIKEGDWFLCWDRVMKCTELLQNFPELIFSNGSQVGKEDCKKIIAATDTLLKFGEDVPGVIRYKSVPQPSTQFIEKYIEEYNKGNQITDVLVEVERKYIDSNGKELFLNNLHHISDPSMSSKECADYAFNTKPFIKVNPKDNTITIRKQKDSWSREELVDVLNDFFNDHTNCQSANINKWIEETYKL